MLLIDELARVAALKLTRNRFSNSRSEAAQMLRLIAQYSALNSERWRESDAAPPAQPASSNERRVPLAGLAADRLRFQIP